MVTQLRNQSKRNQWLRNGKVRLYCSAKLNHSDKIPRVNKCHGNMGRVAEGIQRPLGKRERRDPLRAKRLENFQGLETNFGELLYVYILRPLGHKRLGAMRSLGP